MPRLSSPRAALLVSPPAATALLASALLATALLPMGACSKAAESAQAAAIAAASGGKASMTADGKIEVKTDEGVAKIDLKGDKGAAVITGENADGTKFNATFGVGAKVPDGFPLAVIDGLTVTHSTVQDKDGKKSYALMGQVQKPAKAVADFYEPELKKAGLKVTRTETNLGGMVMLALAGEGSGHNLTVALQESNGQTTVTIGGDW